MTKCYFSLLQKATDKTDGGGDRKYRHLAGCESGEKKATRLPGMLIA